MSQKPQVMVVDDDLAMCGFLQDFLVARGYSALTVTSSTEAIRRFHAERPSAVLLDVIMPGMDGLAALAALKQIDHEVPVIVMSGYTEENLAISGLTERPALLQKPFTPRDLRRRIREVLDR